MITKIYHFTKYLAVHKIHVWDIQNCPVWLAFWVEPTAAS